MRRTGWGQTKPPPGHGVDLGHPRNSHVRLIVPFNEAGGMVAFGANPHRFVAWAPFGTFGPWQVTSKGTGLYVAGDTGFGFPSSPAFYTPTGVTVVSRCVFDLQSNFYAKNVAFGDDATWILGTNIGGSDVAGFRTWTAAGERTVTGATDVSDGNFHTVIGTSDGVRTSVYVDGRLDGTRTDSASTINTTTDSLCFGNSFNRNNSAAGVFVWFELHGRAWTPQEVAEYEDSPYDGILPPRRNWWIGRGAASGGVTVAASLGTVTVAGLAATVSGGATLTGSLGTVNVAALAAAVLISQTVAGAVGNAVSVAALAATVVTGSTVAASVGTVTVAGQAATIDTGSGNVSIGASVATVTASALAATVATGTTSTGSAATVSAAALAASVVTGATISASVATVTAQGRAASVTGAATLAGAVATVTAAALAASVSAGSNGVTISAAVALATALALAGSVRIQGGFAVLQDAGPKDGADPLGFAPGDAPPALGTRSKSGMAELT